jgi:hypothetical protein
MAKILDFRGFFKDNTRNTNGASREEGPEGVRFPRRFQERSKKTNYFPFRKTGKSVCGGGRLAFADDGPL